MLKIDLRFNTGIKFRSLLDCVSVLVDTILRSEHV